MDRHALVAALLLLGGVAFARPRHRSRHHSHPHTGGEATAQAPRVRPGVKAWLRVRGIDLTRRRVLIEVGGLNKTPPPNFFTFTDERGRNFVAMNAFCDKPFPSGAQSCELELPDGYERHKMVSLILHLRALHGPPLAAAEVEIADAWAAATHDALPPAPEAVPAPPFKLAGTAPPPAPATPAAPAAPAASTAPGSAPASAPASAPDDDDDSAAP